MPGTIAGEFISIIIIGIFAVLKFLESRKIENDSSSALRKRRVKLRIAILLASIAGILFVHGVLTVMGVI